MSGSPAKIKTAFESHFATWDIHLPEDALQSRRSGVIRQAGWTISYVFGSENGREYLDFYACHRMTNEQIWRIYDDGESLLLAAIQEFYICDDPESERQYGEINRRFYKMAQAIEAQAIDNAQ